MRDDSEEGVSWDCRGVEKGGGGGVGVMLNMLAGSPEDEVTRQFFLPSYFSTLTHRYLSTVSCLYVLGLFWNRRNLSTAQHIRY